MATYGAEVPKRAVCNDFLFRNSMEDVITVNCNRVLLFALIYLKSRYSFDLL